MRPGLLLPSRQYRAFLLSLCCSSWKLEGHGLWGLGSRPATFGSSICWMSRTKQSVCLLRFVGLQVSLASAYCTLGYWHMKQVTGAFFVGRALASWIQTFIRMLWSLLCISFFGLSLCLILSCLPELLVSECLLLVLGCFFFWEINCEAYISALLHTLLSGFSVFTLPPVLVCISPVFSGLVFGRFCWLTAHWRLLSWL